MASLLFFLTLLGVGRGYHLTPSWGQVLAHVPNASHICGGAVKGGKICLRLKSDDDPVCKGHEPGEATVEDSTLYVCTTKGPTLTTVYDSYSLSATKLSQDLLDFFIQPDAPDLGGIGPTVIFAFVQDTNFKHIKKQQYLRFTTRLKSLIQQYINN